MDTKIHRNEVFSPDRDNLFITRMNEDAQRLADAGFSDTDIFRMLGTFDYVKVWSRTPSWLFPITRLPSGLRWKDGYKYSHKSKLGTQSITLLCADRDLYIKGIEVPGTHITDPRMTYVKDFEQVKPHEVASYVGTPFDCDILQYYQECGVYIGLMEPVLKTPEQAKASWVSRLLDWYSSIVRR